MTAIPFLDPPAAIVHGRAATGVSWLLQRSVERGELDSLPEAVRAETIAAIAACDLAARAWARRQRLPQTAADTGSLPAEVAPGAPCSGGDDVLSISEAAAMLGVSDRRARDLAGSGLGRLVGGRWLLARSDVQAERDRRGAA